MRSNTAESPASSAIELYDMIPMFLRRRLPTIFSRNIDEFGLTRNGVKNVLKFAAKIRDMWNNSVVFVRYPSLLGAGGRPVRRVTKSISVQPKSIDEDSRELRAPPSLTFSQLLEEYSSKVSTGELSVVFIGLTETQHHPGGTGIEEHEYVGERFVKDELLYQVVSLVRRLCDDSTRWRAELVSKLGGRIAPKDIELCRLELTEYILASRMGGRVGKRVAKLYGGILCFGTIVATTVGDHFPHYVRYPFLSIISTDA